MSEFSDYKDRYEYCFSGWQNWLTEAQTDMEMYLDAQFTRQEHAWAENAGRSLYVFNKLKRQVKLLHGYEIRNRHILKIGPIGREDDVACRQHTGLAMNIMGGADGYDMLSEAFKWGPLITGSNLFELWLDRNGDIRFNRWGHNSFLLDPMLGRRDLSDCGCILTGSWVNADRVKILLPEDADKIDKIKALRSSTRWQRLPGKPGTRKYDDVRLFEQFWEKKTDYKTMLIDRMTGTELAFDDFVSRIMRGDRRRANWFVKNFRLPNGMPGLSKFEKPINKVNLSIYVDEQLVWEGPNPLGLEDYNFVWLAGDWVPECDRDELKLQGFGRSLRDPQKARNKRLNQILDIIESQINQYRLVRQGSLVDNEDAWSSGQRGPIFIKKDAEPRDNLRAHFEQLTAPDIPGGLFNVLEVLNKEETEIGGLNESILGSDDKEIPGILHRYRTGAALTSQQGLFSGYRQAKRQIGRKLVRLHQLHYDPTKVHRILNEWPTQGFYEPDFEKYDCTPTEGLLTDSQRHLYYLELVHLTQALPRAAEVIPISELMKASPIQYKEQLLKAIQQAEAQRQQQMQTQLGDKQRMDKLFEAQAQEDITQAQENRQGAILDRVKAMAEINKLRTAPMLEIVDRLIKIEEQLGIRQQRAGAPRTREPSGLSWAKRRAKQ